MAPELEATHASVRVGAIAATAAMDRAESLDALVGRLPREGNALVRGALVRGLGSLSHRNDTAFAACASMVKAETDVDAREAMARYLADNLEQYPAGRETLEHLMQTEHSNGIRIYVAGKLLGSQSKTRARPDGKPSGRR